MPTRNKPRLELLYRGQPLAYKSHVVHEHLRHGKLADDKTVNQRLQEAREAGLTPFAITIDRDANSYMPLVFGSQGFALVRRPAGLVGRLTQVWTTLARAPH